MNKNENNSVQNAEAENGERLYNEKNTAVIASDTYYTDVTLYDANNDPEERYYELFDEDKPKSKIWSVISLVLGMISVALSPLGWVSLILGVAAIAFAIVSRVSLKYFDGMAVAGLILGIFGIVFGIAVIMIEYLIGVGGSGGNGDSAPPMSDM
ncbi:MAG: DUF4190 domain-containing protein [Clostridia bacterium]|nr:DUF4190 domain-containing protein [Clostridia bacterium]